jgi:hypothetical protein
MFIGMATLLLGMRTPNDTRGSVLRDVGGVMRCWLVKGKPSRNDLSEMLVPGRTERWVTRKPPKAWAVGDPVLFWKSAPGLCVLGAGDIVEAGDRAPDGATYFTLRYATRPLPTPVGIAELRADAVTGNASFLKAGAAGTVFTLSAAEAAQLARLVLCKNPDLPRTEARAFRRLLDRGVGEIGRGLLIRDPYVSWILDGRKTWEIRGAATAIRGRIALIKAGSGTVVGTCELVDVIGPITLAALKRNARKLARSPSEITTMP